MKKTILLILIIAIFGLGFSTIVSPVKCSVSVTSVKDGQDFIVEDAMGIVVAKGTTPATIELDNAGESSFTYLTSCGAKVVRSEISNFLYGNVIYGGIAGVIVDIDKGYFNKPVDEVLLINCDDESLE